MSCLASECNLLHVQLVVVYELIAMKLSVFSYAKAMIAGMCLWIDCYQDCHVLLLATWSVALHVYSGSHSERRVHTWQAERCRLLAFYCYKATVMHVWHHGDPHRTRDLCHRIGGLLEFWRPSTLHSLHNYRQQLCNVLRLAIFDRGIASSVCCHNLDDVTGASRRTL